MRVAVVQTKPPSNFVLWAHDHTTNSCPLLTHRSPRLRTIDSTHPPPPSPDDVGQTKIIRTSIIPEIKQLFGPLRAKTKIKQERRDHLGLIKTNPTKQAKALSPPRNRGCRPFPNKACGGRRCPSSSTTISLLLLTLFPPPPYNRSPLLQQ